MSLRFRVAVAVPVLAALGLGLPACGGKEVVRGANDPSIDAHALSTGLDKDDVQRALSETLGKLRNSPVMAEWRTTHPLPNVAVFPFQNNTSEHIDSMLEAMLSETETWMVESGTVQMIARDRQNQIIREVEGQQNPVFNPANAAKYGRQLGAKYFITGKVSAADERTEDMRRVQYFLFLQVIEIETGAIKFQAKTYTTKAIK
ncbi:Lipoprotein [Labilithrix luteola]|uniref:Lipoprotein n=1 Tax=Labilithrix luteola TaxID=1391654 RepID=A0A0K1PM65_9BACT|nr:penicillin-binding protein activator LpoB [Labilithrix luteola]AKU94628.1 Lipoprotein [Labilithrix luteola]